MFFIISRLIILFLLPLGLSQILIFIGLASRKKWLIGLGAFTLYFFSLGVVSNSIMRRLELPYIRKSAKSIKSADAIVVLSGGGLYLRGKEKILEWGDPDRFTGGINLYKAKKAKKIIFTGAPVGKSYKGIQATAGDFYISAALNRGIPKNSLVTTKLIRNTKEEAEEIAKILYSDHNIKDTPKIILVTSAFHMNRAKFIFNNQGIKVIPFPVDFKSQGTNDKSIWKNTMNWFPTVDDLSKSSMAIREFIGQLLYKLIMQK